MPTRRTNTDAENEGSVPVVAESQSTSLALPADILEELRLAQQEEITTQQQLPTIKIMPAAAGLFEFPDDNSRTVATFEGVILGSHQSNVLWTRKYGALGLTDDEKFPDCSSVDGKFGTPKPGFKHAALGGRAATATDRIECKTCPYNKFGSGATFIADRNPKGKAVTNNKRIYIAIPGSLVPFEMTLPPTSVPAFDEYLTTLTRQRMIVQTVITKFSQQKVTRNNQKYAVAVFTMGDLVNPDDLNTVLAMRNEFKNIIYPQSLPVSDAPVAVATREPGEEDETDSTPF